MANEVVPFRVPAGTTVRLQLFRSELMHDSLFSLNIITGGPVFGYFDDARSVTSAKANGPGPGGDADFDIAASNLFPTEIEVGGGVSEVLLYSDVDSTGFIRNRPFR